MKVSCGAKCDCCFTPHKSKLIYQKESVVQRRTTWFPKKIIIIIMKADHVGGT